MEQFHIDLTDEKPFTLVFPHIPKTGGTTLLYHFRKNFGDNNIVSYGAHNRIVRFFSDLPQYEELSADQRQKLRIVQGHGVSEKLLPMLPDGKIKLLVILRNPVGLARSRFNHSTTSLANKGLKRTAEDFMTKKNKGDFMSHLLINKFRSFIDKSAKTRRDRLISILQKFDYVYTTESMDRQVTGLMDELALPHELERRRVAEKKLVLDVTDAELAANSPLDMEIFETANQVLTDKGQHNPFGFNAQGRAEIMQSIHENMPSEDEKTDAAYRELSRVMVRDLRAEAALAKLASGKPIALENPALFTSILQAEWHAFSSSLTAERQDISKKFLAGWQANNR